MFLTRTTVYIGLMARCSLFLAYYLLRPSVSLSVTRVNQSKTVEVRIMQFSPQSSRIPLVFGSEVSSRNSDGFPPERDHQKVGEIAQYMHCCRALNSASAGLSCTESRAKIDVNQPRVPCKMKRVCSVLTAATTLRFDGSQYFRLSLSGVSRDLNTFNTSLRFRTRQSDCHLLTMSTSVNDAQVRLFVERGRVKLRVPTLVQPRRSSSSSASESASFAVSHVYSSSVS